MDASVSCRIKTGAFLSVKAIIIFVTVGRQVRVSAPVRQQNVFEPGMRAKTISKA